MQSLVICNPSLHRHAQRFFPLLVRVAVSDHNNGVGIHYFVRDICIVLLRWEGEELGC